MTAARRTVWRMLFAASAVAVSAGWPAAAAQAVVAGNPDVALSPTPVIVRMISNAGVNLVGIYGLENPDWLLASTDPALGKCPDVKRQAEGVDSVGGARSVALEQLIRPCGLYIDQV